MKTCYVSSSVTANPRLTLLRRLLQARGMTVVVPADASVAKDSGDLLRETIRGADWVLAVLAANAKNDNVYFELGLAVGLNKRHLLLVEPGVDVPFDLQGTLQLRSSLENEQALTFAVQQMLGAPRPRKLRRRKKSPYRSLGPEADELLRLLDHLKRTKPPLGLESLVKSALERGGVRTITTSFSTPEKLQYDIAVWVDELQPYVGNPLPVEVTYTAPTATVVDAVTRKLTQGPERWLLLLYVTPPANTVLTRLPPTVLHMRVDEFLEQMREHPFPEIIRDLRNRVVHGIVA